MRSFLMAASLALAAIAATPAGATTRPIAQTEALDRLPAEYTRHTREHREWEIQQNMERQQRRDYYRHGRGYDRGDGYGRRYGGPPPHAPAYGYRRNYYERY